MRFPNLFKRKSKNPQELAQSQAVSTLQDLIAPAGLEINTNFLKLGNKYCSTLFILTYPNYLASNWFSSIVNLDESFNISIFFHPLNINKVLRDLRKKSAEIQAQLSIETDRGLVRNPLLEAALNNVEKLRDTIKNILEQQLIYAKPTIFREFEGMESSLPLGMDRLLLTTPLNSRPASTLFPFSSLDLSDSKGILYGVNLHNNSLVIFDRFTLPNANMVVFAQTGAGKSYAVKLEILRSLLLGTNVLIIDPENEYEYLADSIGGSYFKISVASDDNINPFELPVVKEEETSEEVFRNHILNLIGLIKLMLKGLSPQEELMLDRAIVQTYASRDIFPENISKRKNLPLMEDLENVLKNTEGGEDLAAKLYKFTKGSYSGFLNQPSNININNRLVIFGVRELEEELRPIAMYVVLNYIWTMVKKDLRKRIVIIDEGWWLLHHEESASFLFGLVKRARKYYMGVTFITQDIEDALKSPYGKPLITNSALALLLRQSPANIDVIGKALNLTEQEKTILLQASVGTGLFFAEDKHAAIQIIASYAEDQIITSNPAQLIDIKKAKKELKKE